MPLFFLRSLRRLLAPCALLIWAAAARAAEADTSPEATNPRYTGSPVVRSWLAEDYGASPINTGVVQHPRTGFIYVSNERGVLEFDGARWRLIPVPEPRIVTGLCVDARGRVWACGRMGVVRLDPDERGELQARSMNARVPAEFRVEINSGDCVATAQGVYYRTFRRMFFFAPDDETPAKSWRLTEGLAVSLSLWQIDDAPYVNLGRGVILRLAGETLERVPSPDFRVLGVRAGPEGTRQLLSPAELRDWRGDTTVARPSPLRGDAAQAATFLADGRMVFATLNSGLVVCDREGRFLQKIDRAKGLPANNVTAVIEDHAGGVWAALRYGIARVQLDSPHAWHGPAQGREGSALSLALSGGELFVAGTENAVRRGADGRFRAVEGAPGPDREVIAHGDRVYFLGARLRGLEPARGNRVAELENRNYYGLVPVTGAPGRFAHGSNEGLRWAHFAGEKWVSEGPHKSPLGGAFAVLEAPADMIWFTYSNGAARVDFRGGLRTDAPTRRYGAAEGLPGGPAGMFLLGGEIVAAAGGSMVRFDEATGRFGPETRVAGLENFPVERANRGAAPETLWLQGAPPAREIRRVVPAGPGRWRAETLPGETLPHLLPTALVEDAAAQTLWIGAHGALVSRDLAWRPTRAVAPPVAAVRRVETAGGRLLAADSATEGASAAAEFAPDQNALRIAFAAPAFAADHAGASRTHYRTRLDGLDREWSAWTRQAERDFTNLPWRALVFRVQARDEAGRIGPEARFAFSIRPPWWAAPWAWAAYGALGLLVFAGAVRLRTGLIRRSHARLEETVARRTGELAESVRRLAASNLELDHLRRLELDRTITAQLAEEKARLEVLRYQLNPHFLYNSLNSIYGLIFENSRAAAEMVLRLSEFCRSTLNNPTDELSTLEAEIAALRAYLDVEKVRWGARLGIEFDVAPALSALRLPPFLLLPLVENAIKHGARTSRDRMELVVRASGRPDPDDLPPGAEPETVVLEIANRGAWVSPVPGRAESTGIGLENLRQRLVRYYPDAHTFATEAADGWVRVRVTLRPAGLRAQRAAKPGTPAAV